MLIHLFGVWAGPREDDERRCRRRDLVAFLLGVKVGATEGMPRDVFLLVLDFLMPSWDPLRRVGSPVQG